MTSSQHDKTMLEYASTGMSPLAIARTLKLPPGTVRDRLQKLGFTMPSENLVDGYPVHLHLRECGKNRLRIDPKVREQQRPNIEKPLNVVVLGGNGFVGTNLLRRLSEYPHLDVTALSRETHDAMDQHALESAFNAYSAEVVINLAAFVGGIGLNRDNPGDMLYRNLRMGMNVVDACYTAGVRKLIHLGSVCSYPHTPPHIPFIEDDLWLSRPEPTNEPYGVAKKVVGMMLDTYNRQFNFSSAYLIPTNMYGPHDDFSDHGSHVIPAMIKKFVKAKKNREPMVTHWGDGSASRDFLYVDDCCDAIIAAINKMDEPTPINIGCGIEWKMHELSTMIAKIVGYDGKIVWDATKPNGQPRRQLNIDRARQLLDFEPKMSLAEGLQRTIEWYLKENRD